MGKSVAIFAIALVTAIVWAHAGFAKDCDGTLVFGFCIPGGGGGGQPAPAPLLAAGIPAFAALGGGALVARVFRKRKR